MLNVKYYLWIVATLVLFMGCSDSASGPGSEEAPQVPEFYSQETNPDLSLYENNDTGGETMSNYNEARGIALSMGFTFTIVEGFAPFFDDARSADNKNFNNGVWEWSFTDSYEGNTAEIRLTAEESESETTWAMYWTFDDGEGNSYEDAEVLEGTVANDGSEASWAIRTPNPSTGEVNLILDYAWSMPADDQLTVDLTAYETSGSTTGSFEYEQNGSEHTFTLDDQDDNVTIFWNSDTKAGYIEENGMKQCWDENLQNTPCT